MAVVSAGLIMYRFREGQLEVLLVHPGGPFWRNRDPGAWSIPKGHVNPGEELLATAKREFREEVGLEPSTDDAAYVPLAAIRQKSGKIVHAWAFEGDCDPTACTSNTMQLQWPSGSGKWITVPEVDKAEFFDAVTARTKIIEAQSPLIEELERKVGRR